MKNLRQFVNKTKDIRKTVTLSDEKITIVSQSKIWVQNYQELKEITDDQLTLKNLKISGKEIKIMVISKYFIEVEGNFNKIEFGDFS